MSEAQFLAWGWRLPFLLSSVLVGLGLWIRFRLADTPAMALAGEDAGGAHPTIIPFFDLLRTQWRQTLAGTFAVVACFAIYYLTTAFALGYGTTQLGYDKRSFLSVQLFAILFMAAGIVVAGYAADKSSSRGVLLLGSAVAVVVGFVMGPMFAAGSLGVIALFLCIGLFTMGLVYGPLASLLPQMFTARVRYTGVSIAFNVGGILGGGLAPVVAQGLADRAGLAYVGLYISGAAVLTLLGLLAVPARTEREFTV